MTAKHSYRTFYKISKYKNWKEYLKTLPPQCSHALIYFKFCHFFIKASGYMVGSFPIFVGDYQLSDALIEQHEN